MAQDAVADEIVINSDITLMKYTISSFSADEIYIY